MNCLRSGLGISSLGLVLALGALGAVPTAKAGGVELPSAGTRALGRGGAALTRADDPMTLFWNPAGLARAPGIQLSLQTHLIFYDACFQRFGTYGDYATAGPDQATIDASGERYRWDRAADGSTRRTTGDAEANSRFAGSGANDLPLPEVCNSGPPGVVPELIFTARLTPQLGLAVGLVAPAAVGNTRWGDRSNGVVGVVNGLPSPARYSLVDQNLIIAFPTIGLAYRPHPAISIGAAFGWGVAPVLEFTTMTRALRGEEFQNDVLTELSAQDWFVPRVTVSVHAVPHDNLDIMAGFMWQDDLQAEGDLTLTTGYYRDPAGPDPYPVDSLTIQGARIDAPQPWQASLGIRYADRIKPRPEDPAAEAQLTNRVEDAMQNERWDIEIGMVYEINSRVDQFTVNLPTCTGTENCRDGQWTVNIEDGFGERIPRSLALQHQWRDQLSVRVGGDYNILPGVLSARLGFSYETKGVRDGFEQLDFLPLQRFGVHLGATVRIAKRFDISLAYAYIHQTTTTVTEDQARLHQVDAASRIAELGCEEATPGECTRQDAQGLQGEGTLINAGRYRSHFNMLSLGLTYHFR